MTNEKSNTDQMRLLFQQMCEACNADWGKLKSTRFMLESDFTNVTPRETALYKKQVAMHNDRIADLQIQFNTFIVTSAETVRGHLPIPELIDIRQTLIRYGKGF